MASPMSRGFSPGEDGTRRLLRNVRSQRAVAVIEGLDDPGGLNNTRIKALAVGSPPTVGLLADAGKTLLPRELLEHLLVRRMHRNGRGGGREGDILGGGHHAEIGGRPPTRKRTYLRTR